MAEKKDDIYGYQPLWGNWYIEMPIGRGSFGSVYKISREDMGHKFVAAVKHIAVPNDVQYREAENLLGSDEETLTRYFEKKVANVMNEIVLLDSLRGNSNIVSYEEHMVMKKKESLGWDILIKMEYVTSLKKYLMENQMSRREVVRLGIEVCNALELCSKRGILHRDIKEENIFVNQDGIFKLGDFGIARELFESEMTLTKRIGAPVYMAPEMYKEEKYDARIDIYSLGIVLYRLLNCGRIPFLPEYPVEIKESGIFDALRRRMSGEPIPLPSKSGDKLGNIVLKACRYKPEDRYASAQEMRKELEKLYFIMSEEELDEKVTLKPVKKTGDRKDEDAGNAGAGNRTVSIFGDKINETVKDIPKSVQADDKPETGDETVSIFGAQEKDEEKGKDWRDKTQKPPESRTDGSMGETGDNSKFEEDKHEPEYSSEKPADRAKGPGDKKNSGLWIFGSIAAVVILFLLIFWMNSNSRNASQSAGTVSASESQSIENTAEAKTGTEHKTAEADKAAADKATADKAAADKAAAEQAAADKAAADKAAEEQAAADKAAADKAAADKAAEEQAAADKEAKIMAGQMNIGDYVHFGRYYGEPILWRVADKSDGVMLVSERILCLKAFDAAESGQYGGYEGGNYTIDQKYGSNEWGNSNIREWLNSSVKRAEYTTQPPTESAVCDGYNAYADEAGFLSNFTQGERNAIQSVAHDGVTDKVFLLSEEEVNAYIGNTDNQRRRKMTSIGIEKGVVKSVNGDIYFYYWTRTPYPSYPSGVRIVDDGGNLNLYCSSAYAGDVGVLPALNLKSDIYKSGNGTVSEPYVVTGE